MSLRTQGEDKETRVPWMASGLPLVLPGEDPGVTDQTHPPQHEVSGLLPNVSGVRWGGDLDLQTQKLLRMDFSGL